MSFGGQVTSSGKGIVTIVWKLVPGGLERLKHRAPKHNKKQSDHREGGATLPHIRGSIIQLPPTLPLRAPPVLMALRMKERVRVSKAEAAPGEGGTAGVKGGLDLRQGIP